LAVLLKQSSRHKPTAFGKQTIKQLRELKRYDPEFHTKRTNAKGGTISMSGACNPEVV